MHVIKQVEELAEKNNAKEVKELTLEVGEVSGVVKEYFLDAFEWAKKRTKHMQECKLNFIWIQGISYCEDCKETFKTTEFGKTCPKCGSGNTYLVTGRDVFMRDIKVVQKMGGYQFRLFFMGLIKKYTAIQAYFLFIYIFHHLKSLHPKLKKSRIQSHKYVCAYAKSSAHMRMNFAKIFLLNTKGEFIWQTKFLTLNGKKIF